jgi:hypothetical protein
MFFNPDDVKWFRKIELHTKMGRTGQILEPLGSFFFLHGLASAKLVSDMTILSNRYPWIHEMSFRQPDFSSRYRVYVFVQTRLPEVGAAADTTATGTTRVGSQMAACHQSAIVTLVCNVVWWAGVLPAPSSLLVNIRK